MPPKWLTIDFILNGMSCTILDPRFAWISVLVIRQLKLATSTYFIASIVYAICLTVARLGALLNQRLAYRARRTVELDSAGTVVVTGGASGLGLLIARACALRGARVAVLDVREVKKDYQASGISSIRYYHCDVGKREQVESTRKRIENDVGYPLASYIHLQAFTF